MVMRTTAVLICMGICGVIAAGIFWVVGYQLAGYQCVEGGRGHALVGNAEGSSVAISGDKCRATAPTGTVVEVELSEWQWNGLAAVVLGGGITSLGVGGVLYLRLRD